MYKTKGKCKLDSVTLMHNVPGYSTSISPQQKQKYEEIFHTKELYMVRLHIIYYTILYYYIILYYIMVYYIIL